MRYLRILALAGICLFSASLAHAQVSVGIGVGPVYGGYYDAPQYVGSAPLCTYGYYDYYPYGCAPYGYYGPEWFSGGFFIGAGPWFHGGPGFWGGHRYYDRGFRDFGNYHHFDGNRGFRGGNFQGNGGGFRGNSGSFRGNSGSLRGNGGGNFHGNSGGSFHGNAGGNVRGSSSFHGGGGGSHGGGGGSHGGGRR
jgi:hypothetical protein